MISIRRIALTRCHTSVSKVAIIGGASPGLRDGFQSEAWEIVEFVPGQGEVPVTLKGADLVVETGPDRAAYKQKMVQLIQANVPAGVPVLVLSDLSVQDLRECAIRPEDIHRIDPISLTVDVDVEPDDLPQLFRSRPA